MSELRFDPVTYSDMVRSEVLAYDELQQQVAQAAVDVGVADGQVTTLLDLGSGTGETLAHVLARHPGARAVGLDENEAMLAAARSRLGDYNVTFVVADLGDPLPAGHLSGGQFDLITSVLAIHHLDGPGKAALFRRVFDALRFGGRFVLGDVVIPEGEGEAIVPLEDDYDKPSLASDQVRWLEEAGFLVEMRWHEGDLAVITADRPPPSH
jgi:tRNA (cmo5U34)-methyltransferase